MADENPQTPDTDSIDKVLLDVDPEFSQSLQDLRSGLGDSSVEIESMVQLEDNLQTEEEFQEKSPRRMAKIKNWVFAKWLKAKIRMNLWWENFKVFLKFQPKEFLKYCISQFHIVKTKIVYVANLFFALSRVQKLAMFLSIALVVAMGWLLKRNLSGSWLPRFQEEFLSNYEPVADHVYTIEGKDMVLLREALPQPEFEVLLEKVVVNLKRRPGFQENPMGAYEFYVGMDTNDAAIEARARKREFIDVVSRALENLTYPEVIGPLGSERIKKVVKEALNATLTQGYVQTVYIKTNITKP